MDEKGQYKYHKKVYNRWNLSYRLTYDKIEFSRVKYNIDNGDPMDLGMVEHEVALIGYEEWNDEYGGDKVLILLEPNIASTVSVTLNSSGNFSYTFGGMNDSWKETFEF